MDGKTGQQGGCETANVFGRRTLPAADRRPELRKKIVANDSCERGLCARPRVEMEVNGPHLRHRQRERGRWQREAKNNHSGRRHVFLNLKITHPFPLFYPLKCFYYIRTDLEIPRVNVYLDERKNDESDDIKAAGLCPNKSRD